MRSSQAFSGPTETRLSVSGLNAGTVSQREYKTMLNKTVRQFTRTYGPKSRTKKKRSLHAIEKKKDKKEYNAILAAIEEDERILRRLEKENAILHAQIDRCQAKIKAYPRLERRYEILSKSIETAHYIHTSPKKTKNIRM